jgi:hypothetical protein
MNEAQELHCHNCNNYVRFNLDLSIDDNYKLICPSCGHEHYRVVRDGIITDERWGRDPSQNDGWSTIYATSWAATSYQSSTTGATFVVDAWANTTDSTWA